MALDDDCSTVVLCGVLRGFYTYSYGLFRPYNDVSMGLCRTCCRCDTCFMPARDDWKMAKTTICSRGVLEIGVMWSNEIEEM